MAPSLSETPVILTRTFLNLTATRLDQAPFEASRPIPRAGDKKIPLSFPPQVG
jgi:hypothetical protein